MMINRTSEFSRQNLLKFYIFNLLYIILPTNFKSMNNFHHKDNNNIKLVIASYMKSIMVIMKI